MAAEQELKSGRTYTLECFSQNTKDMRFYFALKLHMWRYAQTKINFSSVSTSKLIFSNSDLEVYETQKGDVVCVVKELGKIHYGKLGLFTFSPCSIPEDTITVSKIIKKFFKDAVKVSWLSSMPTSHKYTELLTKGINICNFWCWIELVVWRFAMDREKLKIVFFSNKKFYEQSVYAYTLILSSCDVEICTAHRTNILYCHVANTGKLIRSNQLGEFN